MVIKDLLQISKSKSLRFAGFLLMHLMEISKTELLLGELEVPSDIETKYHEYIKRFNNGEPLEYIINSAEFSGHTFYVDGNVLIPRDETELLVETAIEILQPFEDQKILDIGTGSGCIAISLAKAIPNAKIFVTDISLEALNVAKRNAESLNVLERIKFLHSDITKEFPPIDCEIDLLISNPPYISPGDKMVDAEVHKFQPHSALYADENGLAIYRHIAERASGNVKMIALEVGYNQAEAVAKLLQTNGFHDIKIIPDFSGIQRVIIAERL